MKNLARLKMLTDEMLMRALTGRQTGMSEDAALLKALSEERARILVVDDKSSSASRLSGVAVVGCTSRSSCTTRSRR